jgi:hypothetical protein
MSIKFEYAINVEPYEHVVKKEMANELLEALETLVVFTTPTKRNAAALNKAYAAIAKATGETK